MVDPYDYITGAQKRVWLALQGNPLHAELLVERALERALMGADVRIVTEHTDGLYEVVGDFVRRNGAFVKNLRVAEAKVADDIYIIDDKAWMRINGRMMEIDVKEAEEKFKKLLKGDERAFEKSWNKRSEILVAGARRRVLAVIPRISKGGVRALVKKAANVDVYVITNDKPSLISTINRIMRDNDRRFIRANRRMMLWDVMVFLVGGAIFIGLPILFYLLLSEPKALLFFILLEASLPFASIFFGAFFDYVNKEFEDAEGAIRRMKKALKNLNVLNAPVAEEFYVVDDRAWAVRGDELIEINMKSAEEEFVKLWRIHEGPLILGKDVEKLNDKRPT